MEKVPVKIFKKSVREKKSAREYFLKKVPVNQKSAREQPKSGRELFFDKVPVNLESVRELFSKSVPFTFQQHTFKKYPGPVPFIFTLRTWVQKGT